MKNQKSNLITTPSKKRNNMDDKDLLKNEDLGTSSGKKQKYEVDSGNNKSINTVSESVEKFVKNAETYCV